MYRILIQNPIAYERSIAIQIGGIVNLYFFG